MGYLFLDIFPAALNFAQSTTSFLPESPRQDLEPPGSKCKPGVLPGYDSNFLLSQRCNETCSADNSYFYHAALGYLAYFLEWYLFWCITKAKVFFWRTFSLWTMSTKSLSAQQLPDPLNTVFLVGFLFISIVCLEIGNNLSRRQKVLFCFVWRTQVEFL